MKSANSLLSLIFILLFSACEEPAFYSVRGKDVLDPAGNVFIMKGTNLGNWLVPEGYMFKFEHTSSPRLIQEAVNELIGPEAAKQFWKTYLDNYINRDDIRYLKSIGMNSIRLPFHYKLFTDEDYLGGRGEARGFELLDKAVQWCKEEGLGVLLDMHCAPGGQTGDNIDDSYGYPFLFESPESQEMTVAIWKKIADRYKNEPAVIGYDLLNEPIPHFFDQDHFNPLLEPLYKKITAAVREVDPNHLIFLGGAQWDSNFKVFGPPFDDKLVYTFHKYWTATTVEVIQDYLDFRDQYNVPIYCGETGENSDEWVTNFRKTLDENQVGWHFWPYKKMDNTAGIVTFPRPEGYDLVKGFADSTRVTFEDIRKATPADREQARKALDGFLENCLFVHCSGNGGYIEGLGFGG